MSLDKAGLAAALKAIFEDVSPTTTAEAKASAIADAIDAFVKTGEVSTTVASGIAVQVDPNTGIGATSATGTGTGSIS